MHCHERLAEVLLILKGSGRGFMALNASAVSMAWRSSSSREEDQRIVCH